MPRCCVRLTPLLLILCSRIFAQTAPGSLAGKVTNSQSGDPIPSATVRLLSRQSRGGNTVPGTTTSLPDGSFRFENVAPGSYFAAASRSDFASLAGAGQNVTVGNGQQASDLVLRLTPFGNVAGRVTDDRGGAVRGASVTLYSMVRSKGRPDVQLSSTTETDQAGAFVLKKVPPGKYLLAAEPKVDQKDEPAAPEKPKSLPLVRTFYPRALNPSEARLVELAAGDSATSTDVELRRVATYHVRGKVAALGTGTLGKDAMVTVFPKDSSDSLGVHAALSRGNTFDAPGVQAGSYTVRLTGVYAQGNEPARQRILAQQDVDVEAGDQNDLVLTLMPLINLTGVARLDGASDPSLRSLRIRLLLSPLSGRSTKPPEATVGADGSFALRDVEPAHYQILVSSVPAGTYFAKVSLNRQDVTDGLDLSQGGAGELEIDLRKGGAQVDGTVAFDAAGGQAQPLLVILLPENEADYRGNLPVAVINPTGDSFNIRDVKPGRYFPVVISHISSIWENFDFLAAVARQSTAVELTENSHVQVQVTPLTQDQIDGTAESLGLSAE